MRIEEMHYQFDLMLDKVASNDRKNLKPWEKDAYLNNAIILLVKDRYNSDNRDKEGFETNQKRITELENLHIKSPELQPALIPTNLGNGRYELNLDNLGKINLFGGLKHRFRYLFLTKAVANISKDGCNKKSTIRLVQIDDNKNSYNQPDFVWGRTNANFGRSSYTATFDSSQSNVDDNTVTPILRDINNQLMTKKLGSLYFDTTDKDGVSQFTIDNVEISYIKYPNRVFVGGYDALDLLSKSTSNTSKIDCDLPESMHDEVVRQAVLLALSDLKDQAGAQISAAQVVLDKQ
jgi:hypothetical protein